MLIKQNICFKAQLHIDITQLHIDITQLHIDITQLHIDITQLHIDIIQLHIDITLQLGKEAQGKKALKSLQAI
jgi:hypothetical protein